MVVVSTVGRPHPHLFVIPRRNIETVEHLLIRRISNESGSTRRHIRTPQGNRGKILSRPERLSFHRGGDFSEIWLGSFLGACSRHGRTLSQTRKRNGADFSRRWPRLPATFPRFGINEDSRVCDVQLPILSSCQPGASTTWPS